MPKLLFDPNSYSATETTRWVHLFSKFDLFATALDLQESERQFDALMDLLCAEIGPEVSREDLSSMFRNNSKWVFEAYLWEGIPERFEVSDEEAVAAVEGSTGYVVFLEDRELPAFDVTGDLREAILNSRWDAYFLVGRPATGVLLVTHEAQFGPYWVPVGSQRGDPRSG